MALLGALGTCSYNGIDLNSAETETVSFELKPVEDSTGRTVKYVRISLTIKTVIYTAPPVSTDATIATYRRALTAYGGAFIWDSKGAGSVRANVPGEASKDVLWGPKPEILNLKSKGNQFAWDLLWRVVICLPECHTAQFQNRLMEASFSLNFGIDRAGWTTRTFTGHLAIPATRIAQDNRRLPDNADDDKYLKQFIPEPLEGFRRESQSRVLGEDKTRLDLTIVDMEMGLNIPPPGVVDVQANHDYSSVPQSVQHQYMGTISATYELQKGTAFQVARDHFLKLIKQRTDAVLRLPQFNAGEAKPFIMPLTFSISEPEIYGKPICKFSFTYITTLFRRTLLMAGLWVQPPDSNWKNWAGSLKAFDRRGIAQLAFKNDQDAIIDLCIQPPDISVLKPKVVKPVGELERAIKAIFGEPDTENSYVLYQNEVYLELMDSTIEHKPLLSQRLQNPPARPGGIGQFGDANGFRPIQIPNLPQTIIQQRTAPSFFVIMSGRAIRVGFEIVPPQLLSVGGVPCVPANRAGDGFSQRITGFANGPTYTGQWRFRYLCPRAPKQIGPPPHPFLGTALKNVLRGV